MRFYFCVTCPIIRKGKLQRYVQWPEGEEPKCSDPTHEHQLWEDVPA